MTRIIQEGFETGDTQQAGTDGTGGSGGTIGVVSATPSARSGTYCVKCGLTTVGNGTLWSAWFGKKTFTHASKTELYYAFGFFAHHGTTYTSPGPVVFVAFDTSGNVNTVIAMNNDGVLRAYYATAGGSAPSNAQVTLIANASSGMSMDAWHHIEIHLVAATGATGTLEVKVDGATVISAATQRTAQTNANFGSFAVCIGQGPWSIGGSGITSYHGFDDIRVNDTSGSVNTSWNGDESIIVLTVTGTGTSVGGGVTSSSGGAINTDVDEIPPNTTDYVTAAASGDGNTFGLSDPTGVASCSGVQVIAYMTNPSGSSNVYLRTKTGAGASDGSTIGISTTWAYGKRLLETDPADSAAWTQTKLAALEAGMKAA